MNKKPLIGILESVHQDGINLLKKFSNVYLDTGKSKKEIFKNVKRYDVIFIKSNIKINKEFIENAKNLKIVAGSLSAVEVIKCLKLTRSALDDLRHNHNLAITFERMILNFPVLGKINGGNSLIKSFLSNRRNTIPTIEKPPIIISA